MRELEGVSGAVNHLVFSGDPLYDGLVVDGIDVNVATPTSGNVIITETGGFTAVREGGPVAIDKYFVRLAADPGANIVYVTVSAARSPQEEADGLGPSTHKGDTIWVCTGADAACDDAFAEFQRHIFLNSDTLERRAAARGRPQVHRRRQRQLERRPGRLRLRRQRPAAPRARASSPSATASSPPTRATTARSSATSR